MTTRQQKDEPKGPAELPDVDRVPKRGDVIVDDHGGHLLVVDVDSDVVTVATLQTHQIARHAWKH